ncbi:hypothetical protein RDWZM_003833 [Blomia tropicalis]|uniref:4-hydroxyphenylpyruvate dioxygenase n=1 Tax=Blomia tropicalis TaxID=40697 RepID=A0A9Q0MFZ1_BLOTA|nr:hypothetical protein RDWZM_003833 [Blomia tropicalis]
MVRCVGLSHLTFHVSNAKQAALNWCLQFGFKPYRFRGLETGHRDQCSHAVKLNDIVLVFVSPYHNETSNDSINSYLVKHGNSVCDVAMTVNSLSEMTEKIRSLSIPIKEWTEEDQDGSVSYAQILAFGSTTHTLIQRNNYPDKHFLPNWRANPLRDNLINSVWSRLPASGLERIDHLAMNQISGTMNKVAQWYADTLQFKRFWSNDDTIINSKNSGLRATFMVNDDNEQIKLTINEPIDGSFKSQIQEFIDYHRGPGVQHIAFSTPNICESIIQLKDRGVEFLETPYTYYQNLEQRLKENNIKIDKEISVLHKHNILVDFDHTGHLYQIFTRPIQDRPTVFLELIERHQFGGFGAGNIKALFESIEEEQKQRGNI